ncbi:MAG: immunoglobulin domain-containing protein, partial [Limisphaerales bacterium]
MFATIAATAAPGQGLHGHVPAALAQSPAIGRVPATQQLQLAIALPLRNREALDVLLADIYNPASPNYRHYLTPEQFTEKFGPAAADYAAVKKWATKNGLKITETHPNRVIIDVAGTTGDVEKALHVTLRVYHHPTEGRDFFAPDTEPTLDLAVQIAHISGLDNYALPQPRLKHKDSSVPSADPNAGSGPNGTCAPVDFRAAYVPDSTLTGTGQSVGLLQFDGYSPSDISYYIATNHLPSVTISNVLLDGFSGTPSGNGGEVEVCLDIEMVISMAPGISKIYMYEAGPSGVWHDILNRMATDNTCKQISCSWYIPGGSMDTVADGIFQQMAAQGQSFFNASGDYDAFCGLIPFPGDTPYITQVGGTLLTNSGPGGSYVTERAWNRNNGVGSGGGISTQYSIPSWQQGISMIANQGSTLMRNVPDVALTADGVYVRADGTDKNVGGTSAAAPLWAGFFALVNQRAAANGRPPIGFANPPLYAIGTGANYTAAFHDTTIGNNTNSGCGATKFPAVGGYDLTTGWGSPTGANMIDALAGPLDSLQISPITGFSGSGPVGGPFDNASQDFSLTNSGNSPVSWTLINTSPWLTASISSGTIAPGAAPAVVTVAVNAAASNLLAGTYTNTVVFSNVTSSINQPRQFKLLVLGAPVITNQPASQFVSIGSTANFNVGAYGVQPLSYQWSFNGGTIANGTNATLSVPGVTLSQGGNYSVVVSNSVGTATSSNAVLTIDTNPRVAIYGAESSSWNADVKAKIVGTGLFLNADIDVFDPSTSTPTLATLQQYAAVLTWSDSPYQDPTTFGNVLADYVDSGGGVVIGAYAFSSSIGNGLAGRLVTGGYLPLTQAANAADTAHLTLVKDLPAHPILQNVNTFDGATASRHHSSALTVGSTQVAHWTDGKPLVAVKGHVIALNFRPTSTDVNSVGWLSGTDGGVIMANSLLFGAVNNSPPIISLQPSNQLVSAGATATFNVLAFGAQPLSYQWQNNGSPIFGATTSGLSITNVQFSDAASYSVIVSNAFGSVTSSNAVLAINTTPPSITTQPVSLAVQAGSPATFSVSAAGASPFSYRWQKNSNDIAGATLSSFTITNAQLSDTASYSVVISNSYGSATSSNAMLIVGYAPTIATQPSSQTVTQSNAVSFSVVATGSDPLAYKWFFNGAAVANATASTLTLTNAQSANAGTYAVVVTNLFGSVTSSNAVLRVDVPPVITQQPAGKTAEVGSTVTFTASVAGVAGATTLPSVSTGTLRL